MRRRPTLPPVVVKRRTSTSVATAPTARGAPADRTIRAWRADAPPERPPLTEAEEARVAVFYYRQRIWKANNPDVLDEFCERLATLDAVTDNLAAVINVENHDVWGPGHFFAAKDRAAHRKLNRHYRKLYPRVTHVQLPKPGEVRSPSSLRKFVRTMRKGEE